jgi:hypothetical protein
LSAEVLEILNPYPDRVTDGRSPGSSLEAAVTQLVDLPEVRSEVDRARDACTALRWHAALRRHGAQAAAESRVRGARASALLDGADLPIDEVRDLVRGATDWPASADPVMRTVRAAVQATVEAEHVRSFLMRTPLQALARLHVAAGAPLLAGEQVGRPRQAEETPAELVEVAPPAPAGEVAARLSAISRLVLLGDQVPGVVLAGLVHADLAVSRPFAGGNALVARAAERAILQESGVDPTGVAVPEVGHHRRGSVGYVTALQAYASGEPDGVAYWLRHCAGAVADGAQEGVRIADAVLAGRLREA